MDGSRNGLPFDSLPFHQKIAGKKMKILLSIVVWAVVAIAMVCILFKNFAFMCYNVGKKDDKRR